MHSVLKRGLVKVFVRFPMYLDWLFLNIAFRLFATCSRERPLVRFVLMLIRRVFAPSNGSSVNAIIKGTSLFWVFRYVWCARSSFLMGKNARWQIYRRKKVMFCVRVLSSLHLRFLCVLKGYFSRHMMGDCLGIFMV